MHVLGLAARLARAWRGKRPYQPYNLKYFWIVLVGFVPHFIAFGFRLTKIMVNRWASLALVRSQLLLLAFALIHIKQPSFWALGLGSLSKFIVIDCNDGLMPIHPEEVQKLIPGPSKGLWVIGEWFLLTRDIVLPLTDTRLWFFR